MRCTSSTRSARYAFVFSLLIAAGLAASAPTSSPAYDRLQRDFGPLVSRTDPSGWPMKVLSVTSDPYKFWRGTKGLYAAWCQQECRDWLADRDAHFPAHGDLHLGNIGTYHANRFGQLAFGMVDFDEATLLPYQIELLSGVVTLQLVAQVNEIELDDKTLQAMTERFVERFAEAVRAPDRASVELESMPVVQRLLDRASKRTYEQMLADLLENGRFRRALLSGKGEVREILQPLDEQKKAIAELLEQATWNNRRFAAQVRYRKSSQWESAIRSVALRTRLGSSGSQGLEKILVLVERPFVDRDHDGVFYLKQQVLSAYERAAWELSANGVPPFRCHLRLFLIEQMCQPEPLFSSFAERNDVGSRHPVAYWVTIREPWSDELDHSNFKSIDDLHQAGDILALVAGVAAGRCGLRHEQIDTPAGRSKLVSQLVDRGPRFVRWMNEQYEQFRQDPRVADNVRRAREFIESFAR